MKLSTKKSTTPPPLIANNNKNNNINDRTAREVNVLAFIITFTYLGNEWANSYRYKKKH